MYQKSIVLENQQRSDPSERQTKETKGIFILYHYKSQGYYCSDIMIKYAEMMVIINGKNIDVT